MNKNKKKEKVYVKKKDDNNNNRYSKYLNRKELIDGIKNGELYYGQLHINSSSLGRGFVRVNEFPYDVIIEGIIRRNRALNGDYVVVKLDAPSVWKKTERQANIELNNIDKMIDNLKNMTLDNRIDKNLQPIGRIVGILRQREEENVTGLLKLTNLPNSKKRFLLFTPLDSRNPKGLIIEDYWPVEYAQYIDWIDKNPDKKLNDNPFEDPNKLLFSITYDRKNWLPSQEYPNCIIKKSYGEAGTIPVETEVLLDRHNIDYDRNGHFPEEVLNEVIEYRKQFSTDKPLTQKEWDARTNWSIPDDEIKKRLDLRDKRIFSIDPITAKDLDDAVSIEKLDNGDYRIGVHIADVGFFVKPDTALDKEAQHRCTTIYLVRYAIPMLPHILSENLCSLNPGQDRLAFSVFYTLNNLGELVNNTGNPWYGRTIIRSCCKLDYGIAQNMIDNNISDDIKNKIIICNDNINNVINDVQLLNKVAKARRKLRFKNGSLTLNRVKMSFELNDEGLPISIGGYQIKDSNKLIEEYMLLANMVVARRLLIWCKNLTFLRLQPPPDSRHLKKFLEKCKNFGYNIDAHSSGALQNSIQNYWQKNPDVALTLEHLATHPMLRALYSVVGDMEPHQWSHYALSFTEYTHFTSPIRRYADIIVHRLLQATLDMEANNVKKPLKDDKLLNICVSNESKTLYDEDFLSTMASECNRRKYNAKKAQDDSDLVYLCYMIKDEPIFEEAVLVDVGKVSFELLIPRLGLEYQMHKDEVGKGLRRKYKKRRKRGKKNDPDELKALQANDFIIIGKNELIINWQHQRQIIPIFGRFNVSIKSSDSIPRELIYDIIEPTQDISEQRNHRRRSNSVSSSLSYESVIYRQEDEA